MKRKSANEILAERSAQKALKRSSQKGRRNSSGSSGRRADKERAEKESARARRRDRSRSASGRRRRRRRRSRSPSRSSSSSRSGSVFGRGTFNRKALTAPQRESLRHPGNLLREGLRCMAGFLDPLQAELERARIDRTSDAELRPLATRYLTTILHQARGSTMGVRNARELRTLAEAIDALASGDPGKAGDILMQRFKAVEFASGAPEQGGWGVAQHFEIIPATAASSATPVEMRAAIKEEMTAMKFKDKMAGVGKRKQGE